MDLKMDIPALDRFIDDAFPQIKGEFAIDDLSPGFIRMRLIVQDHHLRPGGTVSGPAMFSLADVAVYLATLAMIGPKALAVTTNMSIDFLRKPAAGVDLLADTTLLKLGRSLSVGQVLIRSEGSDAVVARASATYSLPPVGSAADSATR